MVGKFLLMTAALCRHCHCHCQDKNFWRIFIIEIMRIIMIMMIVTIVGAKILRK